LRWLLQQPSRIGSIVSVDANSYACVLGAALFFKLLSKLLGENLGGALGLRGISLFWIFPRWRAAFASWRLRLDEA
jgi:hypothetical protein